MSKPLAWEQGFTAYRVGLSHFDNPFKEGSQKWTEWDNGWWDAAEGITA